MVPAAGTHIADEELAQLAQEYEAARHDLQSFCKTFLVANHNATALEIRVAWICAVTSTPEDQVEEETPAAASSVVGVPKKTGGLHACQVAKRRLGYNVGPGPGVAPCPFCGLKVQQVEEETPAAASSTDSAPQPVAGIVQTPPATNADSSTDSAPQPVAGTRGSHPETRSVPGILV